MVSGRAAVFLTDHGGEFAHQGFAGFVVVAAFVHEAPQDHRRVVTAVADHPAGLDFLEFAEFRILLDFEPVAPAEGFLPDQHPELVRTGRGTAGSADSAAAHEVAAEVAHQLQVGDLQFGRHGRAELGMGVVAVVAVEAERLAVQQDLPSGGGDGADAEAFDDRVGGGFQPDRVQLRSCRSPELPSRNGQFQLEAVAVPDRFPPGCGSAPSKPSRSGVEPRRPYALRDVPGAPPDRRW